MAKQLDLRAFPDEGYRYNDNITSGMSDGQLRQYLLDSAIEWDGHREPELAYGILRELVWRAPIWSSQPWLLLAKSAASLGKDEEASIAHENHQILARHEGPGGSR